MSAQKKPAKVIDLAAKKRARLVLAAFDSLEHESKRKQHEMRAEVERKARETN